MGYLRKLTEERKLQSSSKKLASYPTRIYKRENIYMGIEHHLITTSITCFCTGNLALVNFVNFLT